MIKIYTTGCTNCKILERQLKIRNKEFELIDVSDDYSILDEKGFSSVPVMQIGDECFNFLDSMKKIQKGEI